MGWVKVLVALYALLNIVGGIEGYVAKHSVPSIISGCIAGLLLLGALALSMSFPKPGYIICGLIALADLGFFAPKLSKGFVIWPAGVMAIASAIVILACIAAIYGVKPPA